MQIICIHSSSAICQGMCLCTHGFHTTCVNSFATWVRRRRLDLPFRLHQVCQARDRFRDNCYLSLLRLPIRVGLINIVNCGEPSQTRLRDIPDPVRVRSFLGSDVSRIRDTSSVSTLMECDAIDHENPRATIASYLRRFGEHADGDRISGLRDDSSCQAFVLTKPCAGALGSSALPPNQGKQIGIPPRMARSCSHRDCELRKNTSSLPAGFHEVT